MYATNKRVETAHGFLRVWFANQFSSVSTDEIRITLFSSLSILSSNCRDWILLFLKPLEVAAPISYSCPDTRPWPGNSHYRRHPSSSCCALALGNHTHKTEPGIQTRRKQINLRLKLWMARVSSLSCQALNALARAKESQPGLSLRTSLGRQSQGGKLWPVAIR